jgi:hypothetical protein
MDGGTESALRARHREAAARASTAWRLAETTLGHSFLDAQRPADERAVAAVLPDLRRGSSRSPAAERNRFSARPRPDSLPDSGAGLVA